MLQNVATFANFGIFIWRCGVDMPPDIMERLWAMADEDSTGTIVYQEFVRKFSAYKNTAKMAFTPGSSRKSEMVNTCFEFFRYIFQKLQRLVHCEISGNLQQTLIHISMI